MVAAGVHIVPLMPARDVISVAVEAERLGYDYCVVADEGFHPDVYACLGTIAMATDRITLGVLTNGYTRHPAVTAAAAATPEECRVEVEQLARRHSLSGVLIDALSSDLSENLAVLADSLPIIRGGRL